MIRSMKLFWRRMRGKEPKMGAGVWATVVKTDSPHLYTKEEEE